MAFWLLLGALALLLLAALLLATRLRRELYALRRLHLPPGRDPAHQETLIRRQLRRLAESLDLPTRADILQVLEPGPPGGGLAGAPGGDLAGLAPVLERLCDLVVTQQDRLLRLLRELRLAMDQQAALAGLQQELEIARHLQLSILPREAPSAPGVEVAALMIPAREVGGDFYDYFLIDDHHLAVVVADVSGKGVPAAFFMAISRTLFKSNALFLREPAQVVTRLNAQLCAENDQLMFVTAFFAVLNLRSGMLDFVNAGHNPPVIRHRTAEVWVLPRSQNIALAVLQDMRFQQGRVQLRSGDTLLLYTDGVTEANDPGGRMFGEGRLLEAIARHQPGQGDLPAELLEQVRAFEAGSAQADDITCVALRYLPPATAQA